MQTNISRIAIFGAGGFGREVRSMIAQINAAEAAFEFVGYFDDGLPKGSAVGADRVLGGMPELLGVRDRLAVVFAIGDPALKEKLVELALKNEALFFPALVHPSVIMDRNEVNIGGGTIITAGCILTVNITVGRHVILNLMTTVGHDSTIGDFTSIMPGVNVSGEVILERGVYLGTGAKVINRVTIGSYTTVGSGAVVTKNLPSRCLAVGVPAKPVVK